MRGCLTIGMLVIMVTLSSQSGAAEKRKLRAGMIGLDTSHVPAFTKLINSPDAPGDLAYLEIVAGYPGGTDLPSSRNRVEKFTNQLRDMGVTIVSTIPELLKQVDVVLLESVDGRIHLEEARQVIEAGKPLFIDKPVAGSLSDALEIFALAEKHKVPCFSSSSLRFSMGIAELKAGSELGELVGCTTWGPCSIQEGIPDMYFYGIHGIEALFAAMGPGCETVTRTGTPGVDIVVGVWKDGRIGCFRGIRSGKAEFGATLYGSKAIQHSPGYGGYAPLVVEIAKFFQTHEPPVSPAETMEIFAFMEAADESKRLGGVPVSIAEMIENASGDSDSSNGSD